MDFKTYVVWRRRASATYIATVIRKVQSQGYRARRRLNEATTEFDETVSKTLILCLRVCWKERRVEI